MTDRENHQLDNYHLLRLLGAGGFGQVYLAEHIHRTNQAPVAIKILPSFAQDDMYRFLTEARTFRLKHPNIVQVLDFGIEGHIPFIVMEYAPNGTLRQRHPRGTRIPFPLIVSYVKQVASALQYAHEERLVHRDVKPENMLIGAQNQVLLSDFGIATIAHGTFSQNVETMTGTIPYMAPEQIQGHPRPASDQYALGVVVYEWLCGDRPFQGTLTEMAMKQATQSPPPLREKVPTISPEVEQVVMTALAKDPRQRFGSVPAFATALEQTILGQVPPVLPPTQPSIISTHMSYHGAPEAPFRSQKQAGLTTRRSFRILSAVSGILLLAITAFLLIGQGSPIGPKPASFSATVNPHATSTTQALATAHAESTTTAIAIASMTAQPQTTPTALQAIYTQATSGTPTISDPLSGEDNFDWEIINAGQGGGGSTGYTCAFTGGTYHSSVEAGGNFNHCLAKATNFSNCALQVQMTLLTGPSGGLLFHSNLAQGIFYAFSISTDSTYTLNKIAPSTLSGKIQVITLISGSSPAIIQGVNHSNTLTVIAQGNTFYLYVNGQYVDNASDSALTSGAIGVFTLGSAAAFNNLKVWELS